MHSIWSVPHTQQRKSQKPTKFLQLEFLKKMFLTTKKADKNYVLTPNNFHQSQGIQHAQNYPTKQDNFKVRYAGNIQHTISLNRIENQHKDQTKGVEVLKKISSLLHLLLPIVLALLGIPFYIMVILKLIHLIH